MFSELKFRNFRGVEKLDLFKLKRLNFISGVNGSGKTSLLEGIFLLCGGAKAELALSLDGLRTEEKNRPLSEWTLRTVFPELSTRRTVVVEGKYHKRGKALQLTSRELTLMPITRDTSVQNSSTSKTVVSGIEAILRENKKKPLRSHWNWTGAEAVGVQQIIVGPSPSQPTVTQSGNVIDRFVPPENPLIHARFITPAAKSGAEAYDLIVDLLKERRIAGVVDILQIIEKRVRDVIPINENGQRQIFIDNGLPNQLVPLSVLGAGFNKLLSIAVSFDAAKGGVLLIDEIENGFHYSYYEQLLNLIDDACVKHDIQAFITTHSGEFLNHLASWLEKKKRKGSASFFRVWRDKDGRRGASQFDAEELVSAEHMGVELR
jgi:hypothetical protein